MQLLLTVKDILEILPHRYPMLLIDGVTEMDEKGITGIKNVTFNEPYFQGHFPGEPIMPGVLQIEAAAQAAAIWCLKTQVENAADYLVLFAAIEKVKFKAQVVPGDQLWLYCKNTLPLSRGIAKMTTHLKVKDKVVMEAEMTAFVKKR